MENTNPNYTAVDEQVAKALQALRATGNQRFTRAEVVKALRAAGTCDVYYCFNTMIEDAKLFWIGRVRRWELTGL